MYQLFRDRPIIVLTLLIANIVLSVWCFYLDAVINFDGVTYLKTAQLFIDGQISDAIDYYSWPFYSLFIAFTAKLLMLNVENAALVLNTLFAISLTLAFVCIVSELSNNNRRIILIAMIVILLFPSINKYRSFIIRDFGYLSCYLWSLYFIFRYCATNNKNHLFGWVVFAALSSLFRFEGIVFVLIAPYFLFLFSATGHPHRKKLLALMSGIIAFASAALIFWYLNDKYMDSVEMAKAAGKDIEGLIDLFLMNMQERLGREDLTMLSLPGILLTSTGDVVYELIRRMAVFYCIFSAVAYYKEWALTEPLPRKIWLIYLITNLLMLVAFSLFNNFLVSRYTMASALTLLILTPFAIDRLLDLTKSSTLTPKLATWFALIVLLLVSIEGLDVRTKKDFVKETGIWIDQNLPSDARIYTNNKLLAYYAKRETAEDSDRLYSLDLIKRFMDTGEIKTFDYVVLIGAKKDIFEDTMRQTLAYTYGLPIKMVRTDDDQYAMVHTTTYNYNLK
jgi:hypothetical protein